jgi:hypothetical protein
VGLRSQGGCRWTVEQFNQETLGSIELTCTRSRFGDEGRKWTMRIGDGIFDLPVPVSDSPAEQIRHKRERFRQACVDVLATREPLGRDALIEAVRKHDTSVKWGKSDTLREWVTDLASDPSSGIIHGENGYSRRVDPTPGSTRGQPPATQLDPDPPLMGAGSRVCPEAGVRARSTSDGGGAADAVARRNGRRTLAELTDAELHAAVGPGATIEHEAGER